MKAGNFSTAVGHASSTSRQAKAPALRDMRWLERYAAYCRVKLDPSLPTASAVRCRFTPAAWRLVCRSPKAAFHPILRNRGLCFTSLVNYAEALVEHGFYVAPYGQLLAYFILSSYAFFDRMPAVPVKEEDMVLLRVASKHGRVTAKQMQMTHEWVSRRHTISTRMTWPSVLRRVNEWYARRQADLSADAWAFACHPMDWRGVRVMPLTTAVDLWDEGKAMATCVYRLRTECNLMRASRFFSVRLNGKRYATLELVLVPPDESMRGADRIYGQWQLQDCRLSFNRIPPRTLVESLLSFASYYNLLAHRPSRAPTPWWSPASSRPRQSVGWQPFTQETDH